MKEGSSSGTLLPRPSRYLREERPGRGHRKECFGSAVAAGAPEEDHVCALARSRSRA